MYKLLGTYQEEWEKQTINHDLYFFQLWVSMLLEHQVWMISIAANFSEKLPVLFFFLLSVSTANLSCLLATTFSSLRFLFNFTSLQSFKNGQRGYLFSHFQVLSSILRLSFLCSSVYEALLALSYSFLSECFFFVMIKLLYRVVEINNTGVTGQSLPPKNDFEHARGKRNSAYPVNLTYETYRHTRHTDIHNITRNLD